MPYYYCFVDLQIMCWEVSCCGWFLSRIVAMSQNARCRRAKNYFNVWMQACAFAGHRALYYYFFFSINLSPVPSARVWLVMFCWAILSDGVPTIQKQLCPPPGHGYKILCSIFKELKSCKIHVVNVFYPLICVLSRSVKPPESILAAFAFRKACMHYKRLLEVNHLWCHRGRISLTPPSLG